MSDRAFRSLARAQPEVIAGLLAAVAPGLLPAGPALVPDDVAPTQIDSLPAELDADFATRVAADELLHVECQGYHDTDFPERVIWYHVGFALRNRRKRRVRTVALWLKTPPAKQPREAMTVDDITVRVTTVVLRMVPASVLLADPRTACFAAGAHQEGRSTDELCAVVAEALRAQNASWAERHMAVVAALMRGRYKSMVSAMEQVNLEPVIIEDLVKFGEDRGLKKGLKRGEKKGELKGFRASLQSVLARRMLELSAEQEQRIAACRNLETLRRWLDQAILAGSTAEALR
jgi:hypothetical protein